MLGKGITKREALPYRIRKGILAYGDRRGSMGEAARGTEHERKKKKQNKIGIKFFKETQIASFSLPDLILDL